MNKTVFSWCIYDWGNSAFATIVMAAVLPVFFSNYVAGNLEGSLASSYWGYANTLAMLLIAVFAPFLGSVADVSGKKKLLLGTFTLLGVISTFMLSFSTADAVIFVLLFYAMGRIGFAGGNIFYDSLLPHVASPENQDKVSSWGYAAGYLGGGLVLALNLLWIMNPESWGFANTGSAVKFSFAFVGLWWLIFTIPLLINVKEPKALAGPGNDLALFVVAWKRTILTFKELKANREIFKFLIAFFLYNDGIGTIMVMAVIFGAEINIPESDLIGAILLVQFVGVPATYLFGWLAGKISTKHAIIVALTGYLFISIGGYFIVTPIHFWMLALGVGLVQGGAQALSRSFYSNMIPKEKSAEYFSFYDIFSKFSSILGPLTFAVVADMTKSSRLGIVSLVVFFIAGIWILSTVRTQNTILNSNQV